MYVSMLRKYHNNTLKNNPRHREEDPSQDIRKTINKSKATSYLFLINMIVKLLRSLSSAQQNKDQSQNHNKEWEQQQTINQQQQRHRLRTDSGLSHCGSLNAFYWYQTSP